MLDFVLFPLIGVLLSLNTINKVFLETKSTWFAGFAGIFAFLCTMWLSGYFLYGLGLFAVFSLLLLITSTPKRSAIMFDCNQPFPTWLPHSHQKHGNSTLEATGEPFYE